MHKPTEIADGELEDKALEILNLYHCEACKLHDKFHKRDVRLKLENLLANVKHGGMAEQYAKDFAEIEESELWHREQIRRVLENINKQAIHGTLTSDALGMHGAFVTSAAIQAELEKLGK